MFVINQFQARLRWVNLGYVFVAMSLCSLVEGLPNQLQEMTSGFSYKTVLKSSIKVHLDYGKLSQFFQGLYKLSGLLCTMLASSSRLTQNLLNFNQNLICPSVNSDTWKISRIAASLRLTEGHLSEVKPLRRVSLR